MKVGRDHDAVVSVKFESKGSIVQFLIPTENVFFSIEFVLLNYILEFSQMPLCPLSTVYATYGVKLTQYIFSTPREHILTFLV